MLFFCVVMFLMTPIAFCLPSFYCFLIASIRQFIIQTSQSRKYESQALKLCQNFLIENPFLGRDRMNGHEHAFSGFRIRSSIKIPDLHIARK